MTAKELLLEYLQNIQNPQRVAELFAEDGAIELPYFKSVNIPPRYQGKKEIETFISDLLEQAPTFEFINIKVLIETPEQVFAEYEINTVFNGKPYKQLYMGRLVSKNGKIVLLREACDTVPIERLKN
ncbi:ketosteroid isomerase [Chryseobacterium sp. T16E-39]|uniref:nuclear transport factor 2 family protein n=1 Tax=Chryseobacterium sp. T16E-39 TaxID=2015076 RepID=UPI000B5B2E1A|nr:nuclear transport factor 2 family protein [Chryseobacterium sp. T16E-39]ASK31928.1 ketosteroid isomerase [Chryseobacterium sp. T16E-39]